MKRSVLFRGHLRTDLEGLLGPGRVHFPGGELTDAELAALRMDRAQGFPGGPGPVAFPADIAELSALVKFAYKNQVPLVPSGGRTGLCGGACAREGELAVSLLKMDRLLAFDPYVPSLTVQAGMTTHGLQTCARGRGLYFPIDFAAAGSATIGGNVATNAGGIHVVRYGMTRDWVMGLKVVTGTGDVLHLGGPLRKDNTGLDLRQLFIGSEGILGFIAEVTVRLTAAPKGTALFLLAFETPGGALEVLHRAQKAGLCVHAYELFDRASLESVRAHLDLPAPFTEDFALYALLEVEGDATGTAEFVATTLDDGVTRDAVSAESSAARSRFWSYREGISESLSMGHVIQKYDVSLPPRSLEGFMRDVHGRLSADGRSLRAAIFGHLGDGNLHVNVVAPPSMNEAEFRRACPGLDADILGLVRDAGGSISAEHGIGLLKRSHLHLSRSPGEIALMRELKRLFDPRGILNPGKVLPDEDPATPARKTP